MKNKIEKYNALEAALLKHDDKEILVAVSRGERVKHSSFLTEVENIHSADIRYLVMKYGIDDSIRDTVEDDLQLFGKAFDCTETLIILDSPDFEESPMAPEFKDAIVDRDVDAIDRCIENGDKITESFFVLSVMPNCYHSDALLLRLLRTAMDRRSRCFFLMKLLERIRRCSDPLLHARLKNLHLDLLYVIFGKPDHGLEDAIAHADSEMIIYNIADGGILRDPAAVRNRVFFEHASFKSAMFLFEIGMTRADRESAIKILKKAAARSKQTWYAEEIELLEDSLTPFPDTVSARERQLEKAIRDNDDCKVMKLIDAGVSLSRPDAMVDPAFAKLAVRTMIAVATRGVGLRVLPHVLRRIDILIANTELSETEHDARIMVSNLVIQVAVGNLTWEKDQNRKALYPMEETPEFDDGTGNADASVVEEECQEENSGDGNDEDTPPDVWDNSPRELADMYGAKILTLKCPKCGTAVEAAAFPTVDFAEAPELRRKLPAMFGARCEQCGHQWSITYPMICRDAATRCLIRVCSSEREAEKYRFSVAETESAALKGDYRLRTAVGWYGALEKFNIFESELDEFAIGYLKKLVFDKEHPEAIYFEECDDGKVFFHMRYRNGMTGRLSFTMEMYEHACDIIQRAHLPEKHRSHFVDMNAAESIETQGEDDGK